MNYNENISYSTMFELGNGDIMQHTPFVKIGNKYFSVLTRYGSDLCLLGSKKIPMQPPAANTLTPSAAITGASANNGSFALISSTYPFLLRGYNPQGNIIFSKKISSSLYDNNLNWIDSYGFSLPSPKITYNHRNGNIFVIFPSNNEIWPFGSSNASINVIEVSPTGNFVNSFRLGIASIRKAGIFKKETNLKTHLRPFPSF